MMTDEITLARTEAVLNISAATITNIYIDKEERNLYLVSDDGHLNFFDISDKTAPVLRQNLNVVTAGERLQLALF